MPTIYGQEIEPAIGSLIKPDGWRLAFRLEESDWAPAAFRLPTGHTCGITSLSVNVKVTGRTLQWRDGGSWVRVQIEFVGDGEPSVMHHGWMLC